MTFEIAAGTVAGAAHVRTGRNDQDAFHWASSGDALVAFVCDGCGSGKHSEVGAAIGARLLVTAALERIRAGAEPPSEKLWEDVRRDVLARIRDLANAMGDPMRVIAEHFLFTLVGFAASPAGVAIVSCGDGVIALNGKTRELGPFPGNEPPYLAYALAGRDLPIQVHHAVFREEVHSALLGTDGVGDLIAAESRSLPGREEPLGPLSQFWSDDLYFANRDAVRRRLAIANRAPGLLPDDTTLIAIRRRV